MQGEQAGATQERVQEEFLRARRLLGLIELDEDALAAYIKAHKTGAFVGGVWGVVTMSFVDWCVPL